MRQKEREVLIWVIRGVGRLEFRARNICPDVWLELEAIGPFVLVSPKVFGDVIRRNSKLIADPAPLDRSLPQQYRFDEPKTLPLRKRVFVASSVHISEYTLIIDSQEIDYPTSFPYIMRRLHHQVIEGKKGGMSDAMLNRWLDALGYDERDPSLHLTAEVPAEHPYSIEIESILDPNGAIRAKAVFDVEGMPTVGFFEQDSDLPLTSRELDQIRQRIWNQNLLSVVLVIDDERLTPLPVVRSGDQGDSIRLPEASAQGPFSAADVRSNDMLIRHRDWFDVENRVDQHLLKNLGVAVRMLTDIGLDRQSAQTLLGQVMFISYLEHRGIVGDTYRQDRRVQTLESLVNNRLNSGIALLVECLQEDFNGDFLSAAVDDENAWLNLSDGGFDILEQFLRRVDLETGQGDFWNYDFSYIPVELLSGIYETFLDEERDALAAYYTPRHLANLAIEQAFEHSEDILGEVIYDGACGSGILLTTAFRRMLGVAESRGRRQLSLAERINLLQTRIFGSDVSDSACRVTAFSLYLSLLERLEPSDILALQRDESVKLPQLHDRNLFSGHEKGDFFSPGNPLAGSGKFTLLISNPPWKEPSGQIRTSADEYAEAAGRSRTRRQLAADFAYRALDSLKDRGRLCLIMPVSQFLATTSAPFVRDWLSLCRINRLINFGDLQQLLFQASHGCVIAVGERRKADTIPVDEVFDYWVPKADLSLLLGRLTMHSGDRHRMQTQAVCDDPSRLVTFMWGEQSDLALWARLTLGGTLKEQLGSRWTHRKGVHFVDRSIEPESAEPLRSLPYISADALKTGLPVFHPDLLAGFPPEVETVARIGSAMEVFNGPRVLFPDGMSNDREIRATFYDKPASFKSSIGVITGRNRDSALLRFLAVYLRSDLATYFILMRSYQTLCERNRISLKEIQQFPFVAPEDHSDPKLVERVFSEVDVMADALASGTVEEQQFAYEDLKPAMNELVFDYFGLTEAERHLVAESVQHLLPAARPRSYKRLFTGLQSRSTKNQMEGYARRLEKELVEWRNRLQGDGIVGVCVDHMRLNAAGPIGVVRISVGKDASRRRESALRQSDLAVQKTLCILEQNALFPIGSRESIQLSADTLIWNDGMVYLIRPLIVRCWLERAAIRDARRIVSNIHNSQPDVAKAAS